MRKILDEFEFENEVADDPEDGSDALKVYVLGPSDHASERLSDQDVVRLAWRSPSGDDLYVNIGRDWLVNAIHKGKST